MSFWDCLEVEIAFQGHVQNRVGEEMDQSSSNQNCFPEMDAASFLQEQLIAFKSHS